MSNPERRDGSNEKKQLAALRPATIPPQATTSIPFNKNGRDRFSYLYSRDPYYAAAGSSATSLDLEGMLQKTSATIASDKMTMA